MITVISDFNKRVDEIDEYYDLLNNFINDSAVLFYPTKRTHKTKTISEDLIKVMKANCFLLLYNLMESSIKSSIREIYDSITVANIKYDDVINEIKKIWIQENYKNFNNKGTEFIFDSFTNITNDIIDIQFNSDKTISGNIDAQKIRSFSDKVGFSMNVHYMAKNGVKLHQVKTQRNGLAHGSYSFSECGRQYTFDQLNTIKNEVVIFLRGILNNIKKYIDNEKYKI
ncbi:MAE_28990/MAE_18760 family HEPN-like nuclease [Saccharicrinis sp. FJH2]|uniref:MAE_28990/MAE_18760 family HEPN-like nuclease n=1 Tax=Saccharicrinis sp. FJH65 TaxID=3344659 RepID=UPI0035F4BCE7